MQSMSGTIARQTLAPEHAPARAGADAKQPQHMAYTLLDSLQGLRWQASCPANAKNTRTTMDIAQKKLVIQQVLSSYLHGEDLIEAVILWELRYSRQPAFAFQGFLSEICTTPALTAQRSRILQSLLRALTGEDGKLLKEPRANSMAAAAVTEAVAAPVLRKPVIRDRLSAQEEEALAGCVQLVNTVFARTPSDMNARMRELLLEHLPQLDLSHPAEEAVQAWLNEGAAGPQDIFIAEGSLREIVRLVHVALCEFLSRARADQLLKEALQQTENYYRGSFPLRKLWAA